MSVALRPSSPPYVHAKRLPPRAPDSSPGEPSHPTECERVKEGDAKAVEVFNRVLARRGVSSSELAETFGCGETVVRAIRSKDRRKPLKLGHVFAMDSRTALALWAEVHKELLLASGHGG